MNISSIKKFFFKKEELEIVFDRGVESVQNNSFYFLIDICNKLNELLLDKKNNEIESYFNLKFKSILDTLTNEFGNCIGQLGKMLYNDVKFAKLACCLRFLNLLSAHSNQENKSNLSNLLNKLNKNKQMLNCFIQVHSN